jgi:hypothetical protein
VVCARVCAWACVKLSVPLCSCVGVLVKLENNPSSDFIPRAMGVRCNVLCETLSPIPVCHSIHWCDVVWCGVVWCGVVWCGVVWCGVVWCGVVWCGGFSCWGDTWYLKAALLRTSALLTTQSRHSSVW